VTTHELKTWPEYYEPLAQGLKTWEYRQDDRSYAVGDVLHLREYEPLTATYTGRECRRHVTYVAEGGLILTGYVVMSIVEAQP
jgi:hypothetical protein